MTLHSQTEQIGTGAYRSSPFQLDQGDAYQRWRDRKLARSPRSAEELLVEVRDPAELTATELDELRRRCHHANMALYRSGRPSSDKAAPRQLGRQLGLIRLDPNMLADDDGITTLSVVEGKSLRGYIPYSNRRLLWHTDGYYNTPERRIRAMLLHCVSPAGSGGENGLLDHELVYLFMREENPDYVRALMAPDAMTIPANEEAGEVNRGACTGPVFSVDPADGTLHMRYTARTRSIEWKDEPVTRAAVQWLEQFLARDADGHVHKWRLAAGEGIVCNNVLHSRSGFENGGRERVVYRARYYDRIDAGAVGTERE